MVLFDRIFCRTSQSQPINSLKKTDNTTWKDVESLVHMCVHLCSSFVAFMHITNRLIRVWYVDSRFVTSHGVVLLRLFKIFSYELGMCVKASLTYTINSALVLYLIFVFFKSESYDTLLGFNMMTYRSSKNLWKSCVEHHTFFRLHSPQIQGRRFPLRLGSKFHYSGRTEFQTVEDGRQRARLQRHFVRWVLGMHCSAVNMRLSI